MLHLEHCCGAIKNDPNGTVATGRGFVRHPAAACGLKMASVIPCSIAAGITRLGPKFSGKKNKVLHRPGHSSLVGSGHLTCPDPTRLVRFPILHDQGLLDPRYFENILTRPAGRGTREKP